MAFDPHKSEDAGSGKRDKEKNEKEMKNSGEGKKGSAFNEKTPENISGNKVENPEYRDAMDPNESAGKKISHE
jgi:hypothetical protein